MVIICNRNNNINNNNNTDHTITMIVRLRTRIASEDFMV